MKRNRTTVWFIVLLVLFTWAVPEAFAEEPDGPAGHGPRALMQIVSETIKDEQQAVEDTLQNMSSEQKILQLFVVDPEELDPGVWRVTAMSDTIRSRLKEYPVGGIIFFADNLETPKQTRALVTAIRDYAMEQTGLPPILCVDEEGGRVARVSNNDAFGLQKTGAMNTIRTEEDAQKAGYYIGSYLYMLGFNMNLAPVADVLTVSDNTSIGDRSFGSDPQTVARLAGAYSHGLHAAGILCTYKHFPGDGATASDTHNGFAYTEKSLQELTSCELVPFADAQRNGADAVMTAHISLPGVTGDNTPASLSRALTTDLLRKSLGYKGLIITDSLEMGAIIQNYTSSQAAVGAVKAGADLILQPDDFQEAMWALKQAVGSGEISKERLDESVRRIVAAKRGIMRTMGYITNS